MYICNNKYNTCISISGYYSIYYALAIEHVHVYYIPMWVSLFNIVYKSKLVKSVYYLYII